MIEEKTQQLSPKAVDYLLNVRKLSKTTIAKYKLQSSYNNMIVIPFFNEDDELKLIKYRADDGSMIQMTRKNEETGNEEKFEMKTYTNKGGKPVLLGSNLVEDFTKPLIICYGDFDSMSADTAGFDNCVSLPFGDSGLSWIDKQFEWLEKFNKIILCPDNDENPKTKAKLYLKLQEMSSRLGKHRCYMTQEKCMKDCKDLNEILQKFGVTELRNVLNNVIAVPEEGLIKLSEYIEPEFVEGTPIGIPDIDKATGGHADGGLTIIAGDNNAGKTTFALNLLVQFMKNDETTFYWSGEQVPGNIRWWLEQIIAGPKFIETTVSDKTGREYHHALLQYVQRIREWYGEKFFIYNKRGINAEEFFGILELAVRRHGIKKVVVDNLMAFTGSSEDYLIAQAQFSESCKAFAIDWNVHIILIAHNRKNDNDIPTKDDVEGSKKVTNWADIIYQVKRVFEIEKFKYSNADGIISLCKNRDSEILVDVRTIFEPNSKRICQFAFPEMIEDALGWEPQIFNLDAEEILRF